MPARAVKPTTAARPRIYGLPAGKYIVATTVRSPFATTRDDIRVMTDTEVRNALAVLSAPGGGRTTGAVATGQGTACTAAHANRRLRTGVLSRHCHGVSSRNGQRRSRRGAHRRGFSAAVLPTAKIEGLVLLPDGTPLKAGTITMVGIGQASIPGYMFDAFRTAQPDAEGRFTFAGVTPERTRSSRAARRQDQRPRLPAPTACVRHRRCGPPARSPSMGRTSLV